MEASDIYIPYLHGKGSISTTFENCDDRMSTVKILRGRNESLDSSHRLSILLFWTVDLS